MLLGLSFFVSGGALKAAVEQAGPGSFTGPYHLLVNGNNRYSADQDEMTSLVRRLYLGEVSAWPDGDPSLPLGRPSDSAAAQAFARLVLKMDQADLSSHWQDLARSTKLTPPQVIPEPRDLLPAIARNSGAFAVVAESEVKKLPAKVRVLFTFGAPPAEPIGPSIADVEDFIERNSEQVRSALTDFNRNSGDSQVKQGEAGLIYDFEVLGSTADNVLVELNYSWRVFGTQRERTDYLLVRLVDGDLRIAERVAGPNDVALASVRPEGLIGIAAFNGRWEGQLQCEDTPQYSQSFRVDIDNGAISADDFRGAMSGSVDPAGEASVLIVSYPVVGSGPGPATIKLLGRFTDRGLNSNAAAFTTHGNMVSICDLEMVRPAPIRSREEG